MKNTKKRTFVGSRWETIIYGILSFGILIVVWHLISMGGRVGKFFPSPFVVIRDFVNSFVHKIGQNTMFEHIFYSLRRVTVGFGLGVIIGIPLGLIMACSKACRAFFMPLFSIIRPIPGLAWIPLAILWFFLV